jgi:hypothetical protein
MPEGGENSLNSGFLKIFIGKKLEHYLGVKQMRSVMKAMIFYSKILLPLALMVILFQGCYTRFVTMREEEPSYQQEQQSADQNDSTYYGEDNDNWQSHQYLGFSYYYPAWRSYWSWDYGCIYPSYWDPWYWGPAFYVGYSYYPHYGGYWNSYPGYGHWGYGGHHNYSHQFVTRNSGYQRGGNSIRNYGATRSGNVSAAGSGTVYNGQGGTSRGDVNLPRTAGSVSTGTTRISRSASSGVSTYRQSSSGRYNPSVQQPRHRDRSTTTTTRSYRIGSSRSSGQSRSQGTSNGQTRSSERSSAPSYTPQPSTRTSSAPSSAPAPRNDGGGGRQSSGSGRTR